MAEHTGFWLDAWRGLRRRPKFVIAAALILLILVVAAFPSLFTAADPTYADPSQSMLAPSAAHWFGTDLQGHDIYSRTVYGARASVTVGLGATLAVFVVGGALGALAGFYGSWIDAVVSRVTDVFLGLPLLLAAIVLMQVMHHRTVWTVIAILALFGWPQVARIARGAVLEVRASDYVLAAKALGLNRFQILLRHALPNAVGPVIAVATVALGIFIVTEATLIAWVAPSARAIGPTISSPEAETTTTSRPHSLWAAMRSAASANTSGVTMSCRVSLTIDRTWAPLRGVCAQLHVCPQLRLWDWCPTPWTPHGGWVTVFSGPGGPSGSHPVGSGVLAMLTDPGLRDELDRVAAAVGVRVVHLGGRHPVSRKTWSAAAAVVLDHAAADRCGRLALPRRTHVSVLTGTEAATATWAAAITVGAQHVLRMPEQEGELVRELAEAAESARDDGICGAVVAVIGGRGGAGASLFAVALAQAAADALLVDLDPWAGGIDLLVGGETAPGLRWPDLALQGGRLNWSAVRAALPRPRGISVLSGTRRGYELDAGPVDAVIDAGRRGGVTVVCDLPRRLTDATQAALDAADLVVLVSPCDVRACAAAATMAPVLTAINPNLGLVVRGPSPGGLRAAEVADVAGVPLLASMRAQPRLAEQLEHGGLRLRRRSVLASAARRVLGVLPRAGSGRHGRAA